MSRINVGRVVMGGLAAGVLLNIGDFLINTVLLASDMEILRQRLNLDEAVLNSASTLATWTVVDFLLGLLIVWTYAAMRPRLGPGPTTAVAAGFVPFLAVSLVTIGFTQMGIFVLASTVKNTIAWGVNILIASLVGGWLYKE